MAVCPFWRVLALHGGARRLLLSSEVGWWDGRLVFTYCQMNQDNGVLFL